VLHQPPAENNYSQPSPEVSSNFSTIQLKTKLPSISLNKQNMFRVTIWISLLCLTLASATLIDQDTDLPNGDYGLEGTETSPKLTSISEAFDFSL
jgi:hypothetical protein